MKKLILLSAALALVSPLLADIVVLSNGDRVSGSVVQTTGAGDDRKLVVKSDLMGEVSIAWSAVEEVRSEAPLYLSSEDGQVLVGPVTTREEELVVETAQSGAVAIPYAAIAAVRNEAAQQAYDAEVERLRNPNLTDFWRGYFDTGLALTSGNAETRSFTNNAGATRKSKRDTIKLYFTSVFAQADAQGTDSETVTTANAVRGGSRYELDVSEKLFTFGFVDLEFDEFQDLDLRNVLGGGMGYRFVRNDRMSFDLFGGGSYNQEFFKNDITRRSAEIVAGEEFSLTINDRTSLTERLAFYPNMSNTGEYRLQFDTSLTTDVFQWLGWNVTFSDRFLSNPVPGRLKNDVLLTTGVRVVFGGEKLR